MISASQVYSPESPTRGIGFSRGAWCGCGSKTTRSQALGVFLEARHQFRALHAVGVGRPVIDVGRGHQLAALGDTGDQHRFQVGAGGVTAMRCSWRAGTEDQQAAVASVLVLGHDRFLFAVG